jgi:6-phosphofructokinase 1
MGYLAVELLATGKTNRIISTQNGHFQDVDIDEALSMHRSIQQMEVDVLAAMTGI